MRSLQLPASESYNTPQVAQAPHLGNSLTQLPKYTLTHQHECGK